MNMADEKDTHLSGLYRKTSWEEPPAHVDRAVMELARRSVRRRTLSPFGNHWVAAGALAGVCMISVLLVVLLPQQQGGLPEAPQALQDADAPEPGLLEKRRYPQAAVDEAAADMPGEAEESSVERERFDFYSIMPEAEREVPDMERAMPPQRQVAPAAPMPDGQAAAYALLIGGFSSLAQAEAMQEKLAFMRLDASILTGDSTQTGYRIRVGPYMDLNELERVEALLGKRGIKTTRERVP
jgi:cell division septation protein DedD